MEKREATVKRKTTEVDITLSLNVDGKGSGEVDTGVKFLDHMLLTLTKHSLFDLKVKATGDLVHHVSEDVALVFGEALRKALGEKRGIRRFGYAYVPMDDSLARAVVDLSGRPYVSVKLNLHLTETEDMKIEDIEHFFLSLGEALKANLHLEVLYGSNDHHKIEAVLKALALSFRDAVKIEPRIAGETPSTKGVL